MNTRKETDRLGEIEIPSDLYYGIHMQRAINNFQISGPVIGDSLLFIKGLVLTKKACAQANQEIGAIPAEKADMIIRACDEILQEERLSEYPAYFPTDVFQGGAGTSVNMNTNEVIVNVALEMNGYEKGRYDIVHPNDHVNKSQSTNDAYPTAFRVALYYYLNHVLEKINLLTTRLDKKAAEAGQLQLNVMEPVIAQCLF